MAGIDARDAIIEFYEDYTLTEGLAEDQVRIISQWAEAQIKINAATAEDYDSFEPWFNDMRGLLKMINRFILKRAELEDEQQRTYIRRLIEYARNAGYPPEFNVVAPVVDGVQNLDDTTTIRVLLTVVETGDASAPGMAGSPFPVGQNPDAPQTEGDETTDDDAPDDSDDNILKRWNPFKRPPGLDDIPGSNRK